MGPVKANRYGDALLAVTSALARRGIVAHCDGLALPDEA